MTNNHDQDHTARPTNYATRQPSTTSGAASTPPAGEPKRRDVKARRAFSPAEREQFEATRRAEVQALFVQITDAVAALHTQDGWMALLQVAARFHSYSLNNQLLILSANPQAQAVAGFRAWQQLGRAVRKGERGIRILRPITGRANTPVEPAAAATQGSTVVDAGAEAEVDAGSRAAGGARVIGFGGCSVFDISQTDGPEITALTPVAVLPGDAPAGVLEVLTAHVRALGWSLRYGDSGRAEALANFTRREVVCSDARPGAHTVVSLAHEIAHIHLHDPDDGFRYALCRGQAEVEAESVAFIVASALGVAAAEPFSAQYIAVWAHGDNQLVRAAAERVTSTARTILAACTEPTEEPESPSAGHDDTEVG